MFYNPVDVTYILENPQASFSSAVFLIIFTVSLLFLYFGIFGKGDK